MRHRYNIKHCIIIGSSSGLGAALVEEFLNQTSCRITGVARTNFEKIHRYREWSASGRYNHIELDITSPVCRIHLKSLCSEFSSEPICVIFNAARVATDVNKNGALNYDVFADINRVGIDGFGNILAAFEEHFLKYGGILVGISSFSSFMPPLLEQRVAYPSSKAYLDMAFRCLRVAWDKKVKIVIIHLGHISYSKDKTFPKWISPTYNLVAKKIVRLIASGKAPQEINYPVLYCLIYKYIFRFIPDRVYLNLLGILRYFIKTDKR
ncbi:MAG: SDR family NAD(P)-dependent oxidoreductase [Candidatus Omnitrophota bacterium]|nr:SDR family NAD(P)-dependent oxidoreductase [Candidatus Omnitrophota bacterium]